MSKTEIPDELPRLSAEERAAIMESIWRLEEAWGPTEREKTLLNEAQANYDANPTGRPTWQEVEKHLRKRP